VSRRAAESNRRGLVAAISFERRHRGFSCRAKIAGAIEEDVLAKAVEYARKMHTVDLAQARTLARYAESLICEEA
jgi:hypothetical protein